MLIILNYEKNDISDAVIFHNFITKMPGVTDWWHYLSSSYIIYGKNISTTQIRDYIRASYPQLHCLISEFYLQNFSGFLHPDAWEWLRKYTMPKRIKILQEQKVRFGPAPLRTTVRLPLKPTPTPLRSLRDMLLKAGGNK